MARGVAIGAFAATGRRPGRQPPLTPLRWVGVLLFICAIAHVLDSWSGDTHPGILIWALSVAAPGVFWLFCHRRCSRTSRRFAVALRPAGIAWLVGPGASLPPSPLASMVWQAFAVFSAGIVAMSWLIAWRGWRSDLVEQRRHLRAPLSAAAAGYMLIQALCDFGCRLRPRLPAWVQALVLAGLGLGAAPGPAAR
jgi:hypothetical protein